MATLTTKQHSRGRYPAFVLAGLVAVLALLSSGTDGRAAGNVSHFVDGLEYVQTAVSCSSPLGDDGAFKFNGVKLPATARVYKTNQSSFPSYLSKTDVQNAIVAGFSAWDGATSKALFSNGGTTTAKVGRKDGINTIGFGTLATGYVGLASVYYNNTTKIVTEFDIVFSSSAGWSTNAGKTGDCGGASSVFDVQSVATHEAGHPTGLADLYGSNDTAQTIFGYITYQELFKRTLANGDLAGLTALYGP